MVDKVNRENEPQALPSVDQLKPSEEGGPVARSGFNYQDEIAVSFLIEMLEAPTLLKVHCETHDDILLVREGATGARLAEFVQVKSSAPDKLWSVADLCSRKEGKPGTSVYEISLGRDCCYEISLFRIVTLRPVVSELKILTFPHGAPGREVDGVGFKTLQQQLDKRFPKLESKKRNGSAYWLKNCLWEERHCEQSVQHANLLRLINLGVKEGRGLLLEQAHVLLGELRAMAKSAGDARWEPDREKKIISCDQLRQWWESKTDELIQGVAARSGGKLREKMRDAGLPSELVELAVDLRREYAMAARTSRYMETAEKELLQNRVKSEVISLRSRYVAGQLDLDGANFHALCLDRMDALNAERTEGSVDNSAFLKGCMYDIADRCLLRFTRPVR